MKTTSRSDAMFTTLPPGMVILVPFWWKSRSLCQVTCFAILPYSCSQKHDGNWYSFDLAVSRYLFITVRLNHFKTFSYVFCFCRFQPQISWVSKGVHENLPPQVVATLSFQLLLVQLFGKWGMLHNKSSPWVFWEPELWSFCCAIFYWLVVSFFP